MSTSLRTMPVIEPILLEDFGCFRDGHTDDDIDRVLSRWSAFLGLALICVWDFRDGFGFGGSAELFVRRDEAGSRPTIHHLPAGLRAFLFGEDEQGDFDAATFGLVGSEEGDAALTPRVQAIWRAAQDPLPRADVGPIRVDHAPNVALERRAT